MVRYHADDCRLEAVRVALDVHRPWREQPEEAKERARQDWRARIQHWCSTHPERLNDPGYLLYEMNELRLAFDHLRRKRSIQ